MWEEGRTFAQTRSVQHTMRKPILGLSSAALKLSSQQMQGRKIYSLPTVLFIFCFFFFFFCFSLCSQAFPTEVLKSPVPHPSSFPSVPLQNTMCLMGKCTDNHFLQPTREYYAAVSGLKLSQRSTNKSALMLSCSIIVLKQ